MFTNIEVVLPNPNDVLIIPITAVQYATYGDSVFVVEPKEAADSVNITGSSEELPALVARQQFVRLGETRGDFVVVTKGLSEGEQIVSAGVFKLRNGAPVVINNNVVPDFSLTPSLKDQ